MESASRVYEEQKSRRNNTFDFFAGVDPEIMDELPSGDRFPYVLIGLINLLAILACGFSIYLFFYSEFNSAFIAIGFAVIGGGLIGLALRVLTGALLNKRLQILQTVYLFVIPLLALAFSIPVGMLISERYLVRDKLENMASEVQQYADDTSAVKLAIAAYSDSIKYFENSGATARKKADSLRLVIISRQKDSAVIQRNINSLEVSIRKLAEAAKNPAQQSYPKQKLYEEANRSSTSEGPTDELAKQQKLLQQQKQTLDLVNQDIRGMRSAYYILRNPISDVPYVKELYIKKYRDSIARLNQVSDSVIRVLNDKQSGILALQNTTTCSTCNWNEKFAYFSEHVFTNGSIRIFSIINFLIFLLLFYLPAIIARIYRNDLYHQLLDTKLSDANITTRRREIEERFKIETEIKSTKDTLKNIASQVDPMMDDITNNLTTSTDPKSYIALGDVRLRLGDYQRALEFYDRAIFLDPEASAPWLKKAGVFGQLYRYDEEQQAKKRYTELLAAERFRENLKRETRLKSIEISNLSFYGSFTWHLRDRMNILLGKNGYGKSHLMSILITLLQEEENLLRDLTQIDKVPPTPEPFFKINFESNHEKDVAEIETVTRQLEEKLQARSAYLIKIRNEQRTSQSDTAAIPAPVATEWDNDILKLQRQLELLNGMSFFDKLGIRSTFGKMPVLAIPDSRFINKSVDSTSARTDEKSKKLLEHGAYHFMMQLPYEDAIQNLLNTISNIYLDARNFDDEIFKLIRRVFKRLTGQDFRWETIQRTQDNSGFIIRVLTEGSDTPLPIQKVSQGTLSVISMIGLMYHYLALRYPDVPRSKVTKQPAIIFIDEIDAHLHPSWQQKIIGILRSEFPEVQFIITAHSPLVISGCREEEVTVLRKRAAGFTMEVIESNLIGKPIADIFRMIFEIEEKDEMYLQLSALLPFKNAIRSKAELLRNKTNRSEKEQQQLDELEQQIENFIYLEQFDTIRSTYDEMEDLKHSNESLRLEVDKLKARLGTTESNTPA